MTLKTLFRNLCVALIFIMVLPSSAEAQISFSFCDSLGSYKVQFTPYANSDIRARQLGKPLVGGTTEIRLGTALYPLTPSRYPYNHWWDPSCYADQLGPDDQVRVPRWFSLSGEGGYWIKDWLYVGGAFVWTGGFSRIEEYHVHKILGYYNYDSFTLMPLVRFAWVRTGVVQLYSGVGIGVNFARAEEPKQNYYEAVIAHDLTFLGISVGRNLFGYVDVGVGQRGIISVGMGYRFKNK